MSKLPYVVFFLTVAAIAGATVWHYARPITAATPEVALARQQIRTAAAQPEELPQIEAKAIRPEEEHVLHDARPADAVPQADLAKAVAAEKARNQTLQHAATVIAAATPATAPAPAQNIKLFVQLGLTLVFLPMCLYFILSSRFSVTEKNFAYTTIGTILGFWFTTGA